MSNRSEKIQVQIKYKDIEQQFFANPQETFFLINQFFKEFIPSFELAQKLRLNINVQKLAEELTGLVAFSDDDIILLIPKNKLTDNETILIWLVAYFLGYKLSLIDHSCLSKDELQHKLGKSNKITSTRLGELVKNDFVEKTAEEKFSITTFGVLQFQKTLFPKIKSKVSL